MIVSIIPRNDDDLSGLPDSIAPKNDWQEIYAWESGDAWYACLRGCKNGLYSESEDSGPFDTAEEAVEDIRDWMEEMEEDDAILYEYE